MDGDSRAFSLSQGEPNFAQMIGGSGSCGAGHATLSGCGIRSCAFRAEDSGAVWNARRFPVVRGGFWGGRGSAFMPFQFRAEILFRWRRRNFFSSCHLRAGNKRKSFRRMAGGDAFAFFARRLDKTGGNPCRPPYGGFKETLAGSLCVLLLHAGFGGFAQPCVADFFP